MKYIKKFEELNRSYDFYNSCYFYNNYDKIKKYLEDGDVDVNFKNDDNYTPLLAAVGNSNYDICLLLLEYGANPNIVSLTKGNMDNQLFMIKVVENAIDINSQKKEMQDSYWNFFDKIFNYNIDFNLQTTIRKDTVLTKLANYVVIKTNSTSNNGISHFRSSIPDNDIIYIFKKILDKKPSIHLKNVDNENFIDILIKMGRNDIADILSNEYNDIHMYVSQKKYNL